MKRYLPLIIIIGLIWTVESCKKEFENGLIFMARQKNLWVNFGSGKFPSVCNKATSNAS